MMNIRRSEERGHADHGWLNAKHTFSFSSYYDDRFIGFRDLRVINEDRVAAHEGFGTHGHKDMEIITYILEGALQHKDSMGNGAVIVPGDVQYMSAGTGVMHSEFNHSQTEEVHLLQIWILPEKRGEKPTYGQKHFDEAARLNQLKLVASKDGRAESIQIRQNISLYASLLDGKKTLELPLAAKRHAWVQVAKGEIEVNGQTLKTGDGVAVSNTENLSFTGVADRSEFLVFDLA
jgi:redox-sensitive bicupin YhaK (pirin superfamily)